jgi:hypothetical protein
MQMLLQSVCRFWLIITYIMHIAHGKTIALDSIIATSVGDTSEVVSLALAVTCDI